MTDVIELVNRNLSCTIVPDLGGAITRLDIVRRGNVVNVLHPTPAGTTDPRQLSLTHIAPIGGPVRKNTFKWEGKPRTLEPNFPDEPLYRNGIAWQRPWLGKKDGKFSATLRYMHKHAPGWPFDFSLTAVFDLEEDHLVITYELANESRQGMAPIGFGTSILLPKSRNSSLSAGVSSLWHVDEQGVPTTTGEVPFDLDLKEGLQLPLLETRERWFAGWTGKSVLDYADSRISTTFKADDPLEHFGLECHKDDPFVRMTALSHVPGMMDIRGHDEDETGYRVLGPGDCLSAQVKLDIDFGSF